MVAVLTAGGVIALTVWTAKQVVDLKGDSRELKTVLVGPDGRNGVKGELKELKAVVEKNDEKSEVRHSQVMEKIDALLPPPPAVKRASRLRRAA